METGNVLVDMCDTDFERIVTSGHQPSLLAVCVEGYEAHGGKEGGTTGVDRAGDNKALEKKREGFPLNS